MSVPEREWATLADAVRGLPDHRPTHGFRFLESGGGDPLVSYLELERRTAGISRALVEAGLVKGDRLGLIVAEPGLFVPSFLGAVRAGIVPVPLYPPSLLASDESWLEHTWRILDAAGARVVVASGDARVALGGLRDRRSPGWTILGPDELAGDGPAADAILQPDDLAFLQYTSGSTSSPKGVRVHHGALIANIRAFMGDGLDMEPDRDTGVSWLPLYHDMGLVGFVLGPLYWGVSVTLIPTQRFAKRPGIWLETVHTTRGTVTFAPNFAYARMAQRARPAELERWDLSCVKAFGCGAEPIHPHAFRTFTETFARCGLRATALLPAYGLAESTLAVTMKPLDQPFRVRTWFNGGRPEELVSCGLPFPDHRVEVRDDLGQPVPEGVEGAIAVAGPSIASGYFDDPAQTLLTWQDGWLLTGDKGVLLDGELHVTGRSKDLIILNGRNFHPQSIEWLATRTSGVRDGGAVAFSWPGQDGEELVVVIETNSPGVADVAAEVREILLSNLGFSCRRVVCAPPGTLPKTSSGKVQRQLTRRRYLEGAYAQWEQT